MGYEIEPDLVKESRAAIKKEGLSDLVTVHQKDLFTADLSSATVVTLYLGQKNLRKLLPQLRKLSAGARIVSHEHEFGLEGLKPERVVTMQAEDGLEHTLYFWTAPLGGE